MCSSAKQVTPASTTGSQGSAGGSGTCSEPSFRPVLPLRGCLGQQARQRLVPPREAGSSMGSSSSSETEIRGPVTHQTGWLDDKALSWALGEPGSDAAMAAAHLTPPAPVEVPRWGASLGSFTRLGAAACTPPISRLAPPSEGVGSRGVPTDKPGSWSLFLTLSNGAVRAEHRAPRAARAQKMCPQEPGDRWSLVPSCCLGLGEGGSASLLPPVVRPRPHGGRFGGQGEPKGLECLKIPKLWCGRGRGTGT